MSYGFIKCKWSTREARCFQAFHGTTAAANSQKFPDFSKLSEFFTRQSLTKKALPDQHKSRHLLLYDVRWCHSGEVLGWAMASIANAPTSLNRGWAGWHHGSLSKVVIFYPGSNVKGGKTVGCFCQISSDQAMQVSSGRHVAPSAPAPTLQLQGPCIDIGCILNFWWNFRIVCSKS